MKGIERHPMIMIVIGIIGISLSAIFVKYSQAPSNVTAAYRILWTVGLMSPMVLGKRKYREELIRSHKKTVILCGVSGIFLALHFVFWFESLSHTTVASSTAIVCTEVIWVALGFCLFMKGNLKRGAVISIAVTVLGSLLIALSDYSAGGNHLYGDVLAWAAAVFSAVYTLIGRKVRAYMTTTVYTYIVYCFCGLGLLISCVFSGNPFTGYGLSSVVVGLLLSVFSTILGHSIFSWCLKYMSPSFVSASKLCEPVVAAAFAMVLFGEIPVLLQVTGGIVIIGGVFYYSRVETGQTGTDQGKRQAK